MAKTAGISPWGCILRRWFPWIADSPTAWLGLRPDETNQPGNPDEGQIVPAANRDRWLVLSVCVLLVLAVGLVFGQTVRHEFINFDDNEYVYNCAPVMHGLSVQGLGWAFRHGQVASWHPLTGISLMLDCQLYGLNAGGHHLTNVILHAATAVLLFLVLRQMTGHFWPSAMVAGLFAVHPLRVESVAWVTERKDVLSGLFFMLTLAAYVRYVRKPFSLRRYLLIAFTFSLGMMAKQSLVTMPFVLLLLDYWPLRRFGGSLRSSTPAQGNGADCAARANFFETKLGRFSFPWHLVAEKVPLLVLAAVFSMATVYAASGTMLSLDRLPLPCRIGNTFVSYVAYLGQLFCPQGLAVFYPHPGLDLPFGKVVVAAVVVAGISAASLAGWRRRPHLIVGWLWYVGMLIPVIGLTQTWKQAMADRFTYLPQIGLCIALFWAAADLFHSRPIRRWAWGVTSAMVLAVLMGCAWRQTLFWRDSEILWNHTLACTSRNDVAHHNLAAALAESGRLEEALTHYRKVLEIQPDDVEVAGHIGVILTHLGRLDEALAHYRKLLERKPASAQAHYDFGAALTRLGRCDEALVHYRKALEIRPTHALAHYEMGRLLVGRGKSDEALAHYRMALELQPTHALTHYELGQLLAGRNQCDEALAHYRMALELSPNNAVVHCSLGDLLAGRGQSEEALVHYQQSLKIEPDCAMTRYKLGNFLADRGQYEQASAHYQQALKLQPDCAMAHCKLAWLRATCPSTALRNGAEAIEHAVQAKLLCKGEQTEVLDALAAAYAEAGWFPDALTTAHRALELATRQNNPAFADTLRTRIALYEARRPFHQVQSPSELPQPKP